MKLKHPDWALAYVLQDLTKRGRPILTKAYDYFSSLDEERLATLEGHSCLDEAIAKLEVYVTALKEARGDERPA